MYIISRYVNRLNKISITSCIVKMSIIQQLFLLTLSICKHYIMHISDIFLTLFLFKSENCTKELCFASKSCHLTLYNHLPLIFFFLKIFSTSNTPSSSLLLTILSALFNCTWILLARISSSPKTQSSILHLHLGYFLVVCQPIQIHALTYLYELCFW